MGPLCGLRLGQNAPLTLNNNNKPQGLAYTYLSITPKGTCLCGVPYTIHFSLYYTDILHKNTIIIVKVLGWWRNFKMHSHVHWAAWYLCTVISSTDLETEKLPISWPCFGNNVATHMIHFGRWGHCQGPWSGPVRESHMPHVWTVKV